MMRTRIERPSKDQVGARRAVPSGTTYTNARAIAALCDEVASSRDAVIIHRRGAEDVALVSAQAGPG